MQETNGDGKRFNPSGWYKQKETGAEMLLENTTPEYGSPMIDAFVKGGWVLIDKPTQVPIASPEIAEDVYTETVTKSGATQYRLNGKLISKEQFNSK